MEYTIKDKLLALIFPALCAVYGLLELRVFGYSYSSFGAFLLRNTVPILSVIGGVVTGYIAIRLKIDFDPYLKILTLGTVITFLIYILIVQRFQWYELSVIFHIAVLTGAMFLMTVKMPDDTSARNRLLLTFANPVLYSLINKLCDLLLNYLSKVGALAK